MPISPDGSSAEEDAHWDSVEPVSALESIATALSETELTPSAFEVTMDELIPDLMASRQEWLTKHGDLDETVRIIYMYLFAFAC
jgi:hypothetical protein